MKNKTGGKGHKKQKNSKNSSSIIEGKKEILYADYNDHQDYATILKRLGNGIMLLQLPYNNDTKPENKQILGVVRGSIRKKFIFAVGDVVLFSYRMGLSYNTNEKEKVDILHKYESREKNQILKKDTRPEVKNLLKERNIYTKDDDDDDDDFFFDDSNETDDDIDFDNNVSAKNIKSQPNRHYDISDSENESSDDDIDIEDI